MCVYFYLLFKALSQACLDMASSGKNDGRCCGHGEGTLRGEGWKQNLVPLPLGKADDTDLRAAVAKARTRPYQEVNLRLCRKEA